MVARKLSVALDAHVADRVALAASAAGVSVSAWINRAAEHELAIADGLEGVGEWEIEHGALTDVELATADTLLDRILDNARRAS